jgi:hypothetical protein
LSNWWTGMVGADDHRDLIPVMDGSQGRRPLWVTGPKGRRHPFIFAGYA